MTAGVSPAGFCHHPDFLEGASLCWEARKEHWYVGGRRATPPLPPQSSLLGTWLTPRVALLCCCGTLWFLAATKEENRVGAPDSRGLVDRQLVLGLLVEQVPGKSRALKTDSSEFTFLLYCVTLGKLPKLSVLQFPRGLVLGICFDAESCVRGLHTDDPIALPAVDALIIPVLRMRELSGGVLFPVRGSERLGSAPECVQSRSRCLAWSSCFFRRPLLCLPQQSLDEGGTWEGVRKFPARHPSPPCSAETGQTQTACSSGGPSGSPEGVGSVT